MNEDNSQLGKNRTILDLYLGYHDEYTAKYGDKTVVFCQVGDFFEIYAVINGSEESGPNIYRLADMLGIQVTRRNKSNLEVNRSNYLMSGFPLASLQKHAQALISNCYTVVVVRQTTPPPNVRREVTEILSSSMTLSPQSNDANHILVIMLSWSQSCWECGIAMADVSTGSSMVYEIRSTIDDLCYVFDEITRIMHAYQAKEIVLLSSKVPPSMKDHVIESLGLCHRVFGIHCLWEKNTDCYRRKEYQEAILTKAGIGKGILSNHIISGIDDMGHATVALCYLIQFAYEHNPKLIQRLQAPQRILHDGRLTLQYNSAVQLNIIGTGTPNETPLLSILNRTLTSMGGRLYRERLLNPITNIKKLQSRYEEIAIYIKDDLYRVVRRHLNSILDIERISRRIASETYHPCDWPSFHASLNSALSVAILLERKDLCATIEGVIGYYKDMIDLDEAAKHLINDIRGNIFCRNIYPDIDNLSDTIHEQLIVLQGIADYLGRSEGETTMCKLDCNDRDGYFITTTKKRWDTICSCLPTTESKKYRTKAISPVSNTLRITSNTIEAASDMIIRSQTRIASLTQEKYIEFLRSFSEKNGASVHMISLEIADIDVQTTNAMNACEYGYVKPNLLEGEDDTIEIKQLRHPIIERIQQKIDYVANDVVLTSSRPGLLLYGVNASGKSSLMKAIGIAVIMAQSGMYVPCSHITLTPYRCMFTRISGNDNIYQGLSSFAVEMTELKNILARCGKGSLVLGDELCSGTESTSALSIVASGIEMLLKRSSTFVFATHLHELLIIPEISSYVGNARISVSHMHTEVYNGRIIYDRTLRDGSGEDSYGIEVCRGIGMPDGFMLMAERIRRYIAKENHQFVGIKQSRYNAKVIMDMCCVCKSAVATETHHIRHQQDANDRGFVKGSHIYIHKNNASNLVPLCNECHKQEHYGSLRIHGWRQTIQGIELDFTIETEDMDPKNKRSSSQMDTNTPCIEELVIIWRPYLRYTRKGWMFRKSSSSRSKFKEISEEMLLRAMTRVSGIPSCLIPTSHDVLEHLQTRLLDVSL